MSEDLLREVLCGDENAAALYRGLAEWANTYDDLVDKDKPVSTDQLHRFVWFMMFDLPLNPFYARHQDVLRPLVMTGILNWVAANDMESSKAAEELRVAHVIRFAGGDILLAAMALTGGIEHARRHARRARLSLQNETWKHYFTEVTTR